MLELYIIGCVVAFCAMFVNIFFLVLEIHLVHEDIFMTLFAAVLFAFVGLVTSFGSWLAVVAWVIPIFSPWGHARLRKLFGFPAVGPMA